MKHSSRSSKSTAMTAKAAGRIQGASARSNGGGIAKGSFAARAQSAAAKSANASRK